MDLLGGNYKTDTHLCSELQLFNFLTRSFTFSTSLDVYSNSSDVEAACTTGRNTMYSMGIQCPLLVSSLQVEKTNIGWSLGYMLSMSNMIPSEAEVIPPLTDPVFAGLVFLFSALTIITGVFVFIILIRTCF